MKLIITCGCGDTTQFAKDAFRIVFPKEDLPIVVDKNSDNAVLLELLFEMLAVICAQVNGMRANFDIEEKFAYYISSTPCMKYDEGTGWYNDLDIEVYDLRKGHYV